MNLERIRADVATRRRWIEPVTDEDRAARFRNEHVTLAELQEANSGR